MKISELIKELQKLKKKHGDVDCWFENYNLDCIDRIGQPIYKEIINHHTNYIEEYVTDCHPYYMGVFIEAN